VTGQYLHVEFPPPLSGFIMIFGSNPGRSLPLYFHPLHFLGIAQSKHATDDDSAIDRKFLVNQKQAAIHSELRWRASEKMGKINDAIEIAAKIRHAAKP
jgi:hypothetical protein